MKRLILAVPALVLAAPAAASAHLTHHQAVAYGRAYGHVAHVLGHRAAGCRLIGPKSTCRHSTDAAVLRSTQTLHRMLAPAPAHWSPAPASYSPAPTTSTTTASSSGYAIPAYIVQCESGGDWNAVNPSSGAGGAYQLLPSTSLEYGGTATPQDMSPAEQSAVAARVYAANGASAWSCG